METLLALRKAEEEEGGEREGLEEAVARLKKFKEVRRAHKKTDAPSH